MQALIHTNQQKIALFLAAVTSLTRFACTIPAWQSKLSDHERGSFANIGVQLIPGRRFGSG